MIKFFGILIIVLAIATAVIPYFTDCQSQGKAIELANGRMIPMKCHWAGVAEMGVAIPLVVVGAMMTIFSRRNQVLMTLSILGIVLSALVIAFPNFLIGVCATPTMTCYTVMKPALTLTGGFMVGASIAGVAASTMKKGANYAYAKVGATKHTR